MNATAIANQVALLLRSAGVVIDPKCHGPVPLDRLFEESRIAHAALPGLTRGKVVEYFEKEQIPIGDVGDPAEELAGFVVVAGRIGWAFVRADDFLPRRRFTAAHELGHFVLHRELMTTGYLGDTNSTVLENAEPDEATAMEREANRFAAELLMPEAVCAARASELEKELGCCPRTALAYRLAAELLVSREAMRYRLQGLELGDA